MPHSPADPWLLYQTLIDGIPDGIEVVDALVGHWAVIRAESGGLGLAMTYEGGPPASVEDWQVRGRTLRDVAGYAMSWNLRLASLGVAALNAWYAQPERLAEHPGVTWGSATSYFASPDAFGSGRTAVIGHFPDVEEAPENVIVLERNPRGADLPDAAAEYVLDSCSRVVVTGSTLVNKTLPRILELSADAEVHIVGPSGTPSLDAYPACVVEIAGGVVVDPDACWHMAALGLGGIPGSGALEMFSMIRPAPQG